MKLIGIEVISLLVGVAVSFSGVEEAELLWFL